jgi:hypothetical protein
MPWEAAQGDGFAGPKKAVGEISPFIKFTSRAIGLWLPLG